jgi:hypothetical protein
MLMPWLSPELLYDLPLRMSLLNRLAQIVSESFIHRYGTRNANPPESGVAITHSMSSQFENQIEMENDAETLAQPASAHRRLPF